MSYRIENEELQIASCSIADLTVEQIKQVLDQWGEGASLKTLALFLDRENGLLVLNSDNPNFETYKEIAENFISMDKSKRSEAIKKIPESMKKTMGILNDYIEKREIDKEIDRASRSDLPPDNCIVINEICRRYHNEPIFIAAQAFSYGLMQGKRMERAKRKRGVSAQCGSKGISERTA